MESSIGLEGLRALAVQPSDDVRLPGAEVLALLSRLEQAEQAVQRVREVMADWDTDEDAKGLHFDLERALDGDGRG